MIDPRFFFWNILLNLYILLFPLIRSFLARRKPTGNVLRNFLLSFLAVTLIYLSYLTFSLLGFSEFLLFVLMVQGIYIYYTYPTIPLEWRSDPIETPKVDREVMKRLSRAFHGNIIEDDFSMDESIQLRRYITPYSISVIPSNGLLVFIINSRSSSLFSILHLLALYAASSSLNTSNNIAGQEIINVPLLGYAVSSIVALISLSTISVLYLMLEYQVGSTYSIELPLLYKKILKNYTLEKIKQGDKPDIESTGEYQSELEKARDRARQILEKRNSDVLDKKREQIKSRVDGIFEKDTPALENDTLGRFRLMKTVERILQSTPPWVKVSLKDIAELAEGEEKDVELIIAGLRQSGDVPGIYNIWSKTYSGSKQSQWYITELLHSILEKGDESDIDNIKVYPDGSAEISIKRNKK